MELVTVFNPLTTAGKGETVLQAAAAPRFVVEYKA